MKKCTEVPKIKEVTISMKNNTDISKEWMLGRCTNVGVNFLFAGSLGPCWPSRGSGLPSVTARYFSDKQSCI